MHDSIPFVLALVLSPVMAAFAGFILGLNNRSRIGLLDRRMMRLLTQLSERILQLEQSRSLTTAGAGASARAAQVSVSLPPATVPVPAASSPRPAAPSLSPVSTSIAQPIATPRELAIGLPMPAASVSPHPIPSAAGATTAGGNSPPPIEPPRASLPAMDWEGVVGVKLFSWIAGIALVFAAVFFLRYSIEHGWLSPTIRMIIGLVTGAGLLVGCELRAARRYPVTANALDAAGIAILFSTLFASHSLWKLIPQAPVFAAMSCVAALAVVLSIRRDSIFVALLGLVGGFATPILLSTGQDRPYALFSYLMLLDVGISWVAYRKRWPVLVAMSAGFTTVYEWGWVLRYLDPARLWLAITIFSSFAAVQVLAFVAGARRGRELDSRFAGAATAAALVPSSFVVFAALVPGFGAQHGLLFSFLALVAVGLSFAATALRRPILVLAGAATTILTLTGWLGFSYESSAWPGVMAFLAFFVGWYLAWPSLAERLASRRAESSDRLVTVESRLASLVSPLLLAAFPAFVLLEPAAQSPWLIFGSLFTMVGAVTMTAVVRRETALYVLASMAALATQAVWSARYLTPDMLLPALAVYLAFALLHLGVPLAASRAGRPLDPAGGAVVLLGGIALTFFLALAPVGPGALWGIALLLAVLNAGLFLQDASPGRSALTRIGVALSWAVLGVWWISAIHADVVVPALATVATFGVLVATAGAWTARCEGNALGRGTELALVAHAFLFVVAMRPELSVPPWPMLGVLFLMNLAIGAASLAVRSEVLFGVAIAASQCVLLAWSGVADFGLWPLTAVLAADAVAALGIAWIPLARRRGMADGCFLGGAAVGVVLAQLVAIHAGVVRGLDLGWLVANHVVLLTALLWLAWRSRWPFVALGAAVPAWAAVALWTLDATNAAAWQGALFFCASIYSVFVAYPMALGRRARADLDPYLAAAVSGVPALLLAQHVLVTNGLGHWVGLVPIVGAVCMLALLVRVLAFETAEERMPRDEDGSHGRIALIAGAALAFVTVAIPLQLSREWITVGWALEGAALAWLHRRIRFPQLLWWSAGLAAAAFVRLALNPAVLEYHPVSATPIWNWYLYTYLVPSIAMFASATWLRDSDDRLPHGTTAVSDVVSGAATRPGAWRVSDLLAAAATVLLFLLLNIEIADFYSEGAALTFHFSGELAQDLTYTIGWGLFAIGLLAAGIARRIRVARIAALALLVTTICKCFAHDLWRLGGLYRVASFVGLAICLALVAILLQKFVFGAKEEQS